jgi:hypothetical protein
LKLAGKFAGYCVRDLKIGEGYIENQKGTGGNQSPRAFSDPIRKS